MDTTFLSKLNAHRGVELWRLLSDGAEQFIVRFGRRARLFASRSAAETHYDHHVRQAALVKAH